jgi:4-amino-4-deoxy-L-arabinose transferase-like glycosyltransferase
MSFKLTDLLILSLVSALMQLGFWAVLPSRLSDNESSDYLVFYGPVAHNIMEGRGLTTDGIRPAVRYPPGFPLLLAATFRAGEMVRVSQGLALQCLALLASVSSSLLVHAGARLGADRATAWAAALLWMSYPVYLSLTKQPNVELPFLPLFLGGFVLFLATLGADHPRRSSYLAIGLLIGLAALVRPIAIALAGPLIIMLWVTGTGWPRRQRLVLSLCLLLGNLAAVIPWEVWAWRQTGAIIPMSTGGLPGVLDGLTITEEAKPFPRPSLGVRSLMEDVDRRRPELTSLGRVASYLAHELRERPAAVLSLFLLKAARVWYATETQSRETLIAALQLPYMVLIACGLVVAWRRGGPARQSAQLTLLLVLYFWAMSFVVLSILRYMVPVFACLMIFGGVAVASLLTYAGLVPTHDNFGASRAATTITGEARYDMHRPTPND